MRRGVVESIVEIEEGLDNVILHFCSEVGVDGEGYG
jgi:hypothetical protein